MLRKLIIFSVCVGSSASIPILYQANTEAALATVRSVFAPAPEPSGGASAPRLQTAAAAISGSGRKVSLGRNPSGHFYGEFKLNGRKTEAIVDTGATAVAINLSTARRIGISITPSDLKQTVTTANGKARAALVTIERLDIGKITVDNVQAIVLEDQALDGTLIGMTFLNRLKTFQVDDGAMMLTQ